MNKATRYLIGSFLLAILFWAGLSFDWPVMVKVILFLSWWLVASFLFLGSTQQMFALKGWLVYWVALAVSFVIFGLVLNIFTAWLVFSDLTIFFSLILTGLILYASGSLLDDGSSAISPPPPSRDGGLNLKEWLFILCGLTLLGLIFYFFIYQVTTGEYITSPWDVLSPWLAVVIFFLALVVFSLVVSQRKIAIILGAIIIFSFAVHSYLLVYDQGFGGDRWRHLGSSQRLLEGLEYQPTLLTDDLWYQRALGISVPRALVDAPKLSYGYQWGLSALVSKISHIDVFHIDKYILIIIGGLFLPLLFFVTTKNLAGNVLAGLLSATIPATYYVFQYYFSQTLPIGYGIIAFVLLLAFWASYFKAPSRRLWWFNLLLTALVYFSYSLNFLVALILVAVVLALRWRGAIRYVILVASALSIFWLEVLSGVNSWRTDFSIGGLYNLLVKESNFLYFQAGHWLPFSWSYDWVVSQAVLIVFILMLGYFIGREMMSGSRGTKIIIIFWLVLVINYLLSWQALSGLNYLSRRLDIFIMTLTGIIFAVGTARLINQFKPAKYFMVGFFSVILLIGFVSGPILGAMVKDSEAKAMQYVWGQIKESPANYCVLANTWPLLSLEAYSFKQVVAGNFPSDFNHQQPERVAIFDRARQNPSADDFHQALTVTGATECFLVISDDLNGETVNALINILGQPLSVASHWVWNFK